LEADFAARDDVSSANGFGEFGLDLGARLGARRQRAAVAPGV
jgi:hypothetical protein